MQIKLNLAYIWNMSQNNIKTYIIAAKQSGETNLNGCLNLTPD